MTTYKTHETMKKENFKVWEFYPDPEKCPGTVAAFRSMQNWEKRKPRKKLTAKERERKLTLLKIQQR